MSIGTQSFSIPSRRTLPFSLASIIVLCATGLCSAQSVFEEGVKAPFTGKPVGSKRVSVANEAVNERLRASERAIVSKPKWSPEFSYSVRVSDTPAKILTSLPERQLETASPSRMPRGVPSRITLTSFSTQAPAQKRHDVPQHLVEPEPSPSTLPRSATPRRLSSSLEVSGSTVPDQEHAQTTDIPPKKLKTTDVVVGIGSSLENERTMFSEGPVVEPLFQASLVNTTNLADSTTRTDAETGDLSQGLGLQTVGHSKPLTLRQRCDNECLKCCNPCSPWFKIFRPFCSVPVSEYGIGKERVMFAPFLIETPLPQNFTGFRFDLASGLERPDRAELFWAKQGVSPSLNETEVNYQETRLILSTGSRVFSTTTEIPIRFLDPKFNPNTAGLGDISIATKLLLIDGDQWKLTQFFKTVTPTGAKSRGLGTGHLSFEPGFLAQWKWTDNAYFFGELRYLFAVGGDAVHSGQQIRYGLGVSSVSYETDDFAILPTFELVGFSVLDGNATLSDGQVADVDSEGSVVMSTGVRFVFGPAGDLGLFELGVNTALALNDKALYSTLGTIDLRFIY